MKRKTFVCFGVMLLMVYGCISSSPHAIAGLEDSGVIAEKILVGNDSVVVCHQERIVDTLDFPLSKLTEDFKLIKLDHSSRESMVSTSNHFALSANYLAVFGPEGPVRIFDKEGHFVRQIGSVGDGPEEYMPYAGQVCIDEAHQKIYVTGVHSKASVKMLFQYSLNGKLLKKIPLPTRTMLESLYVDEQQTIHCIHVPVKDFTEYAAWSQDEKGELLSFIPAKTYWNDRYYLTEMGNWEPMMTNLYPCRGEMVVSYQRFFTLPDSLYHYYPGKERFTPCFTVDYSNQEVIPWHTFEEYTHYYIVTIYTGVAGSALPTKRVIVDKESLRGANIDLIVDQLGGFSLKGAEYKLRDGYFYYNLSPAQLEEGIKKVLQKSDLSEEQRKLLTGILHRMTPDDNNYLMLAKLK